MLDLLHQNSLVADEIILLPDERLSLALSLKRVCDVLDGEQKPDTVSVAVVETLSVHDEATHALRRPEVHFISADRSLPIGGGLEQRPELRHIPFAVAKIGKARARDIFESDVESLHEALTGGDDRKVAVEQQDRRDRGGD